MTLTLGGIGIEQAPLRGDTHSLGPRPPPHMPPSVAIEQFEVADAEVVDVDVAEVEPVDGGPPDG